MKSIRSLSIIALLCLVSTACDKDYLNKTPDEDLTLKDVFSQRRYAESFLTNMYSDLPQEINFGNDWGFNPFVNAADELDEPFTNVFGNLMNTGSWTPLNNPLNPTPNIWGAMYQGVRKANIFLENVNNVPMDDSERARWIGEATFLRSFFHFWLLRIYGPIPIFDRSLQTGEDFSLFNRRPIEECAQFILADCDRAASLLDIKLTPDRYGRVTKAAALALKARILLYLASPLYNGNSDYANFLSADGVPFFPSEYSEERWQQAADAALACITESEAAGYALYRAPDNDPVRNYQELFVIRNNPEILFTREVGVFSQLEYASNPTGMGGWSGYCPTQELVDAYEMANGLPISDPEAGYVESGYTMDAHPHGYHPAGIRNMYVNREPRFYASINYSGAQWHGRGIEFWPSGLDGRKGGPDFTTTGYLMKKFLDPNVDLIQGRFSSKAWIFFRLGEQYLNYAEALNEVAGPVSDVYHYINAIRDRAGLPPLPENLSKAQMREKIWHERRIELAFETHRYFDCHRWKIAHVTDNQEIHGMNIAAGASLQDDSFYQRTVVEKRVFVAPRHYLWPIPQVEINKNLNLNQNPGW
ncbi:RagB/SusD family nutrient uptake outer membrane protein [Parapedobacter pyrenivorans]|uniref:RagB/SusD family nutrient uptake outer membrane protein n=1 Tax=Parapedobacter pyrenivorans TaxID=1305674 RepID=UPI003342917C